MRLIDEQRNEDSRRIVRPCSHLLSKCEDGEGGVGDVEVGKSFIALFPSRAISLLSLLLEKK